jgi:hypothetical protein
MREAVARGGRVVAFALLAAMSAACYTTVPLRVQSPARGTTIRVELNSRGADSLARYVGPGIVWLRGDVVESTPEALALQMHVTGDRRGVETYWTDERVDVRRSYAASISERRLSKPRTFFAAAGIAAGLFFLSDALTGWAGVVASGGRTPGPPN